MFSNVSLLLCTCEKNKYLLNNFFKLFQINFPSFDGEIKLTINSSYSYGNLKISSIKKKLPDSTFSTSLIYALKEIKSDYIIFMLDDFYLLKKINIDVIISAISILSKDANIDLIQLNEQDNVNVELYSDHKYNEFFNVKKNRCDYTCNAQFAIWRKKFLLKILRKKESAWNFEFYGTYRINRLKHTILLINSKYREGASLYPNGGVVWKGKIMDNFLKLYKKYNLDEFPTNSTEAAKKTIIDSRSKNLKNALKNKFIFLIRKFKLDEKYKDLYPKISFRFKFFPFLGHDVNYIPDYILDEFSLLKPVDSEKTIGILYIAIGKYICFWNNFYKACEKYFLNGYKKTYILFTDSDIKPCKNVEVVYQENLGWPKNTLFRYEMFLKNEKTLRRFKYVYFINANMIPVRNVGAEIFPVTDSGLTVTLHPAYFRESRSIYAYETNPSSSAFIDKNEGKNYFMGGFNGGLTASFLQMSKTIHKNILADLDKGIIALWHDESHLNRYFVNRDATILSPRYGYPQDLPCNKKNLKKFRKNYLLLIQDKKYFGGHDFLRKIEKDE